MEYFYNIITKKLDEVDNNPNSQEYKLKKIIYSISQDDFSRLIFENGVYSVILNNVVVETEDGASFDSGSVEAAWGAEAPPSDEELRITSYNVCYTKLLRTTTYFDLV